MRPLVQQAGDGLVVLETAALLRELTAGMITTDDLDEALDHLARTSRHAVPDETWSSVTLLRSGEPASVAASDPRAHALDEMQYRGVGGPSMTAIQRREIILSEDLRMERRWPRWRPHALSRGVAGVLSAPVDVDDHVVGAINLYAAEPGVLTAPLQLTAMLLAEHAALLLAAVRDRSQQADVLGELDETLARGEMISQAIGVMMTQRRCPAEEALHVLRAASTALALPLHDVAERLVSSVNSRRSN